MSNNASLILPELKYAEKNDFPEQASFFDFQKSTYEFQNDDPRLENQLQIPDENSACLNKSRMEIDRNIFGDGVNHPSSEGNEEEGTPSLFQSQYQKVGCLESPKMSDSFLRRNETFIRFQPSDPGFNQLLAQTFPESIFDQNDNMLQKMQNLFQQPSKNASKFTFVSKYPLPSQNFNLLTSGNESNNSIYSHTVETLPKSKRKNSSVENLKLN